MIAPHQISPEWPLPTLERLIAFWEDGLSTGEIAIRLGKSRNSVVGKVHRMHLQGRSSPIRRDGELKPPPIRRAPAITLPMFRSCAQCGGTLGADQVKFCSAGCEALAGLVDLAVEVEHTAPKPKRVVVAPAVFSVFRTCQWPEGDPGSPGFRFCGDATVIGKPYCAPHCGRAYVKRVFEEAAE